MMSAIIFIGKYFWVFGTACTVLYVYYTATKHCFRKFYDKEIKETIKNLNNLNKYNPIDAYYIRKAEEAISYFQLWLIAHFIILITISIVFCAFCEEKGW